MSKQDQSQLSRRIQKPTNTARRNDRIVSKIEETPYEPIASPARAATPTSALKQKLKIEDREMSPTSPEAQPTVGFEGSRAAKHEEMEANNKKAEEMTAKKTTKGKNKQPSQGKAKIEEGPKEVEKVNSSISPAKSAPKNNKDKGSHFSEEVQEFIRRRKLELTESEDKNVSSDSKKSGLRESLKKEKKEPQPRLTPDRSKPNRQASSHKESEKEVKKTEKDEEKELLERVENLKFQEILEVDVTEDNSLAYLAAFISEQKDNVKVIEFSEQQLTKLGKMWRTELKHDFLKDYLIASCPKK